MSVRRSRPGRIAAAALYWCAIAALVVGGLKLVDHVVGRNTRRLYWFEKAAETRTVNTLELFPFDGLHVQANFHHRGPMPWNDHTPEADFDIRTGDKGYFIDFSLEDPPPKAADEFRIVLIGGSGAQGWGATTNERMFYRGLERELNARLAGRGVRVRVINLAMGTSFLYQNFIALNQWGHPLEPDLILAYAGRNDFYVPLFYEHTDRFIYSRDLGGFAFASRGSEVPPGMGWLFRLMPNTMRRTSAGLGLKIAFGWEHLRERALASYRQSRGMAEGTPEQVLDRVAVPLLVHGLKSIKRDFEGVPIMLAWQPIAQELAMMASLPEMGRLRDPEFYDRMFDRTRGELAGYLNDRWYFLNVHQFGRQVPQLRLQTHLDDRAHREVGRLLASFVEQAMPTLLDDRARRVAQGLPAGYGSERRVTPDPAGGAERASRSSPGGGRR